MRFLRRFWLWGCVLALGLGLLGYKELRLSRVAKAKAETITCADLGENGPGDNAHVEMTAFELVLDSFVVQSRKRSEDKWSKVWIPATPPIISLADPTLEPAWVDAPLPDFHVIVVSSRVQNEAQLDALAGRPSLRGLILNEVDQLGSDEKKLLRESYPTVDLDTCWILEVDRKPKTMATALAMLGGAVVLLLLSLYVRFRPSPVPRPDDS